MRTRMKLGMPIRIMNRSARDRDAGKRDRRPSHAPSGETSAALIELEQPDQVGNEVSAVPKPNVDALRHTRDPRCGMISHVDNEVPRKGEMSPIHLDRLNVFGSICPGHGVAQFAERLMTPTVKDRGGSSCANPPEGGFFIACLVPGAWRRRRLSPRFQA